MKRRIDLLLVEKKLAKNRSKAQSMIMAGQVYIDEKKVLKSGETFLINSKILIKRLSPEWVSRGAIKLLHAIDQFKININDKICLDIGSSTGGFTQVLLKKNAKKIFAVDVGKNQLHESLKKEKKIISIEKTNARYLDKKIIPEKVDIIVCDVSFISLKKVLIKPLMSLLKNKGIVLCLIKPQFEANKNEIKKGVVTKSNVHERICKDIESWFEIDCKMKVNGIITSPLKGPKGNIEFLIFVSN